MPNDDALAAAIAERDASWERFKARDNGNSDAARVSGAYGSYLKAAKALRTLCPHDRVEERGYGGMMVCVLCGETMQ